MTPAQFRRWRKSQGLSLTEAARTLGVARATVTGWESGRRTIPEIAVKLIQALRAARDSTEEK